MTDKQPDALADELLSLHTQNNELASALAASRAVNGKLVAQAEQHACDAHAVCSKCGAHLWTPGQLAAAKDRAAEYSDWFMGKEPPQAEPVQEPLNDEEVAGHLRSLASITWRDCWLLAEHLRRNGVTVYQNATQQGGSDAKPTV